VADCSLDSQQKQHFYDRTVNDGNVDTNSLITDRIFVTASLVSNIDRRRTQCTRPSSIINRRQEQSTRHTLNLLLYSKRIALRFVAKRQSLNRSLIRPYCNGTIVIIVIIKLLLLTSRSVTLARCIQAALISSYSLQPNLFLIIIYRRKLTLYSTFLFRTTVVSLSSSSASYLFIFMSIVSTH